MYKTPKKLTSEQEAMIHRAYPLEMSVLDIAYFTPTDLTYKCIVRNIGKRPVKNSWAKHLGPAGTNRFASQVYELDDLVTSDGIKGFSRQEIAEGLGVNLKRVDYALENRVVIEPRIIYALRVLYQDQGISTPYLIKR